MDLIEIITPAGRSASLLDLSAAEFTSDDGISLARRLDVLTRLEAAYKEAGVVIRARKQFLDESESKLFEKVQEQQEKETDLEQREEDLCTRSREWREKVATTAPFILLTV
jgi:FtsZ-binding cell division protein ZapB